MKNLRRIIVAVAVLITWIAISAGAQAAEPSFQGKTVRIIVGYSPGGGFDTFSRLLARHLSKHIPGRPSVIVINMPGAGSLVAANRVYAMPGDGLTMVAFHFSMVIQALTGDPNTQFDPLKYKWLGDPTVGALPQVLWVRKELPIKTIGDINKMSRPLTLGVTGLGAGPGIAGTFMEHYLGWKVKNVYGYKGSSNIMVALERGEVDGRILSQATMQTIYRRYLNAGLVRPIFSMGDEPRLKPIPGLMTMKDLKMNEKTRELADFLIETWRLLRVFALPPSTPDSKVEILRTAFNETLKDPALLADAKRQKVIVSPLTGEEVTNVIRKLASASPELIEEYKGLLKQ
jgi:tripartite-type tricarboxylate transporter receptor subunit TctC